MLTPRLAAVAAYISGNTLADIGTDHAYIPIDRINHGSVSHAIACDINKGPLDIAASNIKKNGLDGKIELRLGSGLEPIQPAETNTVVIAGMGGILISDILAYDEPKSHSFSQIILQPMNAQSELRKYLYEHNFKIEHEDLALEGFKVYNILVISSNKGEKLSEIETHLPPSLYSHEYFPYLLAKKKREFSKILSGLERAKERDSEQIEYYTHLMDNLLMIEKNRE